MKPYFVRSIFVVITFIGIQGFTTSNLLSAVTQSPGSRSVDKVRLSAEKGVVSDQLQLGRMYDQGDGVPQNSSQAVFWFQNAAKKGDATGLFLLGCAYDQGKGVLANKTLAFIFFDLAVRQGGQLGEAFTLSRDMASREIAAGQLKQAQTISSTWRPENPLPSPASLVFNNPAQLPPVVTPVVTPVISPQSTGPQRWEYKIVTGGFSVGVAQLNNEGRSGWELVAVISLPSPVNELPGLMQLIYKRKY